MKNIFVLLFIFSFRLMAIGKQDILQNPEVDTVNTVVREKDQKGNNNLIYVGYAPSFHLGNGAKNVFHDIELNYERKIIQRMTISFTQGFYSTSKKDYLWYENLKLFPVKRTDYYFSTYLTMNAILYYNNIYTLKLGLGPSLYYHDVIHLTSNDPAISFNKNYFDKGVLGGLHINLQNDFYIKKNLYLGFKFQTHFIFPKKNSGDKIIIMRPGLNLGYSF